MKSYFKRGGCSAIIALAMVGQGARVFAQPQSAAAVREPIATPVPDTGALDQAAFDESTPDALTAHTPAGVVGRGTRDGSAAGQPAPKPSLWRDLFGDAAGDVKRLPSRNTAAWLAIGGIAAAGARAADKSVGRSLAGASQLHEPLEPGAVLGSTPFQMAGSLAAYGIGRWSGSRKLSLVGADLFRSQLLAEGLTIGLKESVRRQRPEGSGFAFPSGHTTVSFASATVLQRHYGWRLGAPAYGIATYVALSRVHMKRHYLSDVAFGAALGIVAGRTVTLGSIHRLELSPMATPGGGGVQFTWLGRKPER